MSNLKLQWRCASHGLMIGVVLACVGIALWRASTSAPAADIGAHAKTQPAMPTPSTQQAWVERLVAPPDLTNRSLVMLYVGGRSGRYAPAYLDDKSKTIYRWRGLEMLAAECPFPMGAFRGFALYKDPRREGYSVHEFVPPTRYLLLPNGQIGVGYFEPRSHVFYRHADVVVNPSQVPTNAAGKRDVLTEHEEVYKVVEFRIPPT